MPLDHKVTIERTDHHELSNLVQQLDVWCMQRWGRPSVEGPWNRNRNRLYEKRGPKRNSPRIYFTIYSFKELEYAFEFKLLHM